MSRPDCTRYDEEVVLKKYPEFLSRHGKTLLIKLTNGKTKEYVSSGGDDNVTIYIASDVFKASGYLFLSLRYYEGGAYKLVNLATGEQTHIYGPPVFSPKNKYVASVLCCDDSGYYSLGFIIFKITESGLKPQEIVGSKHEISDLIWVSDSRIKFTRNSFNQEKYLWDPVGEGEIVYKDGKWVIK